MAIQNTPCFSIVVILLLISGSLYGSEEEEKLMSELSRGYNPLIPPIQNASSGPLEVSVSLQLTLLIDVNEKDQVMHTNVWLTLKWFDFQMRWKPTDYGGITQVRLSPDKVWLPDIVLFNNADGNFDFSFMCNVVVESTGEMLWVPPALYKSTCIIDVEYFPFDQQTCSLIFGSWTYKNNEITLAMSQKIIDLKEFLKSSIWDIVDVSVELTEKKSRIHFNIVMRRKTLFYTVVLIIPTILMAFLSMAVFFLPADSGEKITLTISVLLSIVVFMLLVVKILPPSSTIPLIAKYLILTFILNVISILLTVIITNVYFRSPTTHGMPYWARYIFLDFMPTLLCMERPKATEKRHRKMNIKKRSKKKCLSALQVHHPQCPSAEQRPDQLSILRLPSADPTTSMYYPLSTEAIAALDAIEYITEYVRKDEELKMSRDDWKYISMIMDRVMLYAFFGITLGGTLGILLSSPDVFSHFDGELRLAELKAKLIWEETLKKGEPLLFPEFRNLE